MFCLRFGTMPSVRSNRGGCRRGYMPARLRRISVDTPVNLEGCLPEHGRLVWSAPESVKMLISLAGFTGMAPHSDYPIRIFRQTRMRRNR